MYVYIYIYIYTYGSAHAKYMFRNITLEKCWALLNFAHPTIKQIVNPPTPTGSSGVCET